ncbi:DUF2335 domain-containing protein [Pusillimonas noertemannii]|uniref:DUF2335 domain-containing protein n=1 Tax=Pusillimonas noertemannii TaxID=305977 RepID=UPI003CC56868
MSKPRAPASSQPKNDNQLVSAQWAGPLPPPNVLEGFSDVVENGAERVFKMAEKEQEHRISYERAELEATRRDFRRGQIIGATLALACVIASVYSVILGAHPIVSVALVGIPIMALIGKILQR